MGEVRSHRTYVAVLAVLGLVSMLAMVVGVGSEAQARSKRSKKPVVNVKIKTSSQAALVKGKVKVRAKATRRNKARKQWVRFNLTLHLGKKTVSTAGHQGAGLRRGKKRVITIKLNKRARNLARKCGTPRLTVDARSKVVWFKSKRRRGRKIKQISFRRSGKNKRTLKQQPSRCVTPPPPVTVPVPDTIDLASADRCDFITEGTAPGTECLFPFPNNYFTKPDDSTDTGLRLNVNKESTPTNAAGKHIDPADLNTSDGFSPGAPIITQVPGLDTIQAFQATGMVGLTQRSKYDDPGQPLVMIDAANSRREPIWAELDANATSPGQTDLEIHTNKNLLEGHRYIVAMRSLKRADGSAIEAPDGFRLYRDNQVTDNQTIESRRINFENIFAHLEIAGIPRGNLYMAWDFTVASEKNLSERMLDIRDDAFKQLGDNNMKDGIEQGQAPAFSINPNGDPDIRDGILDYPLSPVPGSGYGVQSIRRVTGTFQVPCYLDTTGVTDSDAGDNYINGCPAGSKFKLDSDGLPIRTPGKMMTARFTCNIPRSSVKDDGSGGLEVNEAARPSLYGHGLFNSYREGNGTNIRQLGNENNVMVCATDFSGMAEDDVVASALPALLDMSNFATIPDRLQQGFVNFLYLGRLMKTSVAQGGFAGNPAFQDDHGNPLIDFSQLYYYGNSQGGIAGGGLTAVAPDFTRSVLYVPGMRYSELLPRSIDFDDYAQILYPSYPVERTRPLLLTMIQSMWDRGEPAGYAAHMTDDPLPNTPAHKVLIEMAYGDHQVANVTTEAEARTIGAPLHRPALDSDRLQPGLIDPWYRMGSLGNLDESAADGSGMFVWDIGPKRMVGGTEFGTDPAPLTNTSPNDTFGVDPHDTVIDESPLIRKQIGDFLKVNGKITNPADPACGAHACYAAGWNGAP